jgi:hypothetical protein
MSSHVRVLLFCCALLLAPALFAWGDRLGGTLAAIAGAGGVVGAAFLWARFGRR